MNTLKRITLTAFLLLAIAAPSAAIVTADHHKDQNPQVALRSSWG